MYIKKVKIGKNKDNCENITFILYASYIMNFILFSHIKICLDTHIYSNSGPRDRRINKRFTI